MGSQPTKLRLVGVPVHVLTLEGAVNRLEEGIRAGRRAYVCTLDSRSLLAARDDPAVARAFGRADLATADGMPLVWMSRWKGAKGAERVYGPDLMEHLMARMEGWRDRPPRHALFGGAPGVGERLADRLAARFPRSKLVGITVPPMGAWRVEENDAFIEELNGLNPDVIWVGLGAPLQDLWMAEHRGRLTASLLVGVGAAFDFLSGTKPQAPVWMRRAGLEWAFRLASEPRRLGSRYGVTIPRILALGARDLLSPLPPVEGRAQPSLKSDECGP